MTSAPAASESNGKTPDVEVAADARAFRDSDAARCAAAFARPSSRPFAAATFRRPPPVSGASFSRLRVGAAGEDSVKARIRATSIDPVAAGGEPVRLRAMISAPVEAVGGALRPVAAEGRTSLPAAAVGEASAPIEAGGKALARPLAATSVEVAPISVLRRVAASVAVAAAWVDSLRRCRRSLAEARAI
jgi:hypothetical protein